MNTAEQFHKIIQRTYLIILFIIILFYFDKNNSRVAAHFGNIYYIISISVHPAEAEKCR